VGRVPARSRESAAWLTSLWVTPRVLGPKAIGIMFRIIQYTYDV
jgi:hypothetical protein